MSNVLCESCGNSVLDANPSCAAHELALGVSTKAPVMREARTFLPPRDLPKTTAARPPKWRGRTAVELNREGERVRVFHRSQSGRDAWDHPYSERCEEACLRS